MNLHFDVKSVREKRKFEIEKNELEKHIKILICSPVLPTNTTSLYILPCSSNRYKNYCSEDPCFPISKIFALIFTVID
jgi:hypothetical protein